MQLKRVDRWSLTPDELNTYRLLSYYEGMLNAIDGARQGRDLDGMTHLAMSMRDHYNEKRVKIEKEKFSG